MFICSFFLYLSAAQRGIGVNKVAFESDKLVYAAVIRLANQHVTGFMDRKIAEQRRPALGISPRPVQMAATSRAVGTVNAQRSFIDETSVRSLV